MNEPTVTGGVNIAMKIPKAEYDATVSFYRDVLGFTLHEEDTHATPSVSRTHALRFGPNTLWLDRVDSYPQPSLWLELATDDLDAATERLAAAGVTPCDEIEPIVDSDFRGHWVKNPAGVVHLLAARNGDRERD